MDNMPFVVDPQVLALVVIYHSRDGIKGCACGWGELGRSHADHVVESARQAMLRPDEWVQQRMAADPFAPTFVIAGDTPPG